MSDLTARARALADELGLREYPQAMSSHERYSNWKREQFVAAILAFAAEVQAEMIEPLNKSDDPEEATAIRVTPDYVLYTREAADRESRMTHGWRDERDALRKQLAEVQAQGAQDLEMLRSKYADAARHVVSQQVSELRAQLTAAQQEIAELTKSRDSARVEIAWLRKQGAG